MKITANSNDVFYAKEMMQKWNRDYFTVTALETIIDYYDVCFENEIEFNPIDICCEWNEYGKGAAMTINDFMSDYGYLLDDEDEDEKTLDRLLEIMEEKTYITKLDNDNILMQIY